MGEQESKIKSGFSHASLFDVSTVVFSLGPHIVIPSVCVWVLISSSYKDPSQIGLGPILQSHFTLVTSLKTSVSKYSHIRRSCWESNIQICGGHNSAHNTVPVIFFLKYLIIIVKVDKHMAAIGTRRKS